MYTGKRVTGRNGKRQLFTRKRGKERSSQLPEVFGKPLIDQPVIRDKLANSAAALGGLISRVEAVPPGKDRSSEEQDNEHLPRRGGASAERRKQVTYDMKNTKGGPLNERMGGVISLLKLHATKVGWQVPLPAHDKMTDDLSFENVLSSWLTKCRWRTTACRSWAAGASRRPAWARGWRTSRTG